MKRKRKMKVLKVWRFGVLRKEALSLNRTRTCASASSGTVAEIIYMHYLGSGFTTDCEWACVVQLFMSCQRLCSLHCMWIVVCFSIVHRFR